MKYHPQLNLHTGSVNGTIFLLQTLYWHGKMGRPFYKFQNPSTHVLYEHGASWTEELGFSESQLKHVLSITATKLKRGETYDLSGCGLVLYWSVGNGLNYYCPNYPAMMFLGDATAFLESKFPHFAKWKSDFSEVGNDLFKITFSHPRKFDLALSYLHKINQQTTIDYTEKGTPPLSFLKEKNLHSNSDMVILPFETERFRKTWAAWKEYKSSEHHFNYSEKSEQAALLPLGNYDENFAIQLIQNAIANKWKSFHFEDTPNKFSKLKNAQDHGTVTTKNGEKFEPHVASILGKYST